MPFDLRISLGFSFIPEFTSKNSVVEGSKLIKFIGSGGFRFADGLTRPSGSMEVQVTASDSRVMAAGPVGFTAATEAPRLDLAMDWPPATSQGAGYLNFITSYGIVTNGMQSGPMSDERHGIQRERWTGLHVTKQLRDLDRPETPGYLRPSRFGRRPLRPREPEALCAPAK